MNPPNQKAQTTPLSHRTFHLVRNIYYKAAHIHHRGNRHFSKKWSDSQFTLAVVIAVSVLAAVMLWVSPRHLGMANDGTVTAVMQNSGLSYQEADLENANNYFTRVYQTRYVSPEEHSFQLLLIRLAKSIDFFFTNDQLFDIRFLSILYVLLALPAWWLLSYSIISRVTMFVEKCFLSILCILIFADVSILTYFNSLYPEAIYAIGLCYIFGACMMMQRRSRFMSVYWVALLAGVAMLCSTRQHCSLIGYLCAIFCISQLRVAEQTISRIGITAIAAICLTTGFLSLAFVQNDFDTTSQIHSMTRGVLLQADDPEKTIREFGIDGSYAMLTDVSLYDTYAMTDEDSYYLQHGFLDQYSTGDIVLYYLRHPGSMLSMLDLGARSAVNLRREYCGNYERSAGMPAKSKSIFFAAYSIFKSRSLPQTIAFVFLLIIVCIVLSRKGWWKKKDPDRFYYVYFCTALLAAAIFLFHMAEIICRSGDAQLSQYNFIAGFSMDCLILFTMSELLHRLNILEENREESNA